MPELTFSITPYKGFEDEALNLRNSNRDIPQTRKYMDWRYSGQQSAYPSLIFWVQDSYNNRVGMVGMVFRSYYVNNQHHHFAVIGDISLNPDLRGKGVAKKMFEFMNAHIKKKNYTSAFVMPNAAAQKGLSATGWEIEDSILPHVFLIDPWEKIYKITKNKFFSVLAGKLLQKLVKVRLMLVPARGIALEHQILFDKSFDLFWQRIDKEKLVIRDRSSAMLTWRYANHPYNNFKIVKFQKNNQFAGYLIYLINAAETTCTVYDLIFSDNKLIKPAIMLFVKSLCRTGQISSIRIAINRGNPYSEPLRKAGFSRRVDDNIFQVFPKSPASNHDDGWFLTSGDKDT